MAITPEIIEDTLRHYKQTRSPFKTATKVGITVTEVLQIVDSQQDKLSSVQERHGGFGRPALQPFIVARRRALDREWDNGDTKVALARENYEAGTHIMATGRDGSWLILYSVPRRGRPDPMPDYFLPEVA